MKAFVLATGPSLTQEQVDSVRGKGITIAVSDAYKLAPWADYLVSTDAAWWFHNPETQSFAGSRFSGANAYHLGIERVPDVPSGMNSGLVAARLAVLLGAKQVVLLGVDMKGSHFFGDHPTPLGNTSPAQFDAMKQQFADFHPEGVEIVNASPRSSLDAYPRRSLEDLLCGSLS